MELGSDEMLDSRRLSSFKLVEFPISSGRIFNSFVQERSRSVRFFSRPIELGSDEMLEPLKGSLFKLAMFPIPSGRLFNSFV